MEFHRNPIKISDTLGQRQTEGHGLHISAFLRQKCLTQCWRTQQCSNKTLNQAIQHHGTSHRTKPETETTGFDLLLQLSDGN
jgi:hypothetical protein